MGSWVDPEGGDRGSGHPFEKIEVAIRSFSNSVTDHLEKQLDLGVQLILE